MYTHLEESTDKSIFFHLHFHLRSQIHPILFQAANYATIANPSMKVSETGISIFNFVPRELNAG